MARYLRQRVLVAFTVALAAGALTLVSPALAGAVTGTQGPSFVGASASVPPSGPKPESKLWFNDGFWWGYMFDSVSGDFHLFKFNTGPQTWTDTGVVGDTRNNTTADVLWDGAKLYVASHVQNDGSTGTGTPPANLYRYSYNASTDTYSLDGGFPAQIHNQRMETLVIARDSTGQLWATWTEHATTSKVWVNSTVCSPVCDDATWGTPFSLNDAPLSQPAISSDDISSIIAFGGNKVGLMWSNQATNADYFAVHNDTAADNVWTIETATSGPGIADDHINLKTDSSGRVYAATKTNLSGSGATVRLLVRTAGGSWVIHVYGTAANGHTRAIVLLDQANSLIRMYATSPESGDIIYEKTLPLAHADNAVDFAPGLGTVFMDDGGSDLNNSTSTKQNLDASTGLLVLATNLADTSTYWQRYLPLTPDVTPPIIQTAVANGAALTMTYNETLNATSGSVPANGAFAVSGGHSVTGVSVTGSTVVLTLSPAVTAAETGLTLSYTPGTNRIEDIALNDAAALVNFAVTNSTSGGGTPFTMLPNGDVATSNMAKSGTTLFFDAIDETIALTDNGTTLIRNSGTAGSSYVAQLTDTPGGFVSMSALTMDIRVRTTFTGTPTDDQVALFAQVFRSDGVTPLTNEVTVGTNPGAPPSGFVTLPGIAFTGVVAADKAAWDGAQLKLRWTYTVVGVSNTAQLKVTTLDIHATPGAGGPDGTPPVFQSAAVNGSSLTMTYNETLDSVSKPATSAFAVTVNGAARGVSTVGIAGSTVTLTLASPVVAGNTVTVAYTKPGTNPLQDVAGNDAANLAAATVTNNTPPVDGTPPVFQSAAVNGSSLTMTYNETLDSVSKPATSAFAVTVNGAARGVSTVGIAGSTVTLTLASPVVAGNTVTVAYTKPGTNPLQDVAGNDAANLAAAAVTNNTPPPGGGSLTLRPNGDGTITPAGTIAPSGTATLFDAIDEPVATPDDGATYAKNNNKTSGSYFAQLTDTPGAFALMQSLTIDVRARTTGAVDDQTTLFAQVFQANGVTPLTNEVSVATNPGPGGFVTISGVTLTGLTGGSKAIWDGAQLRLRWAYTAVGTQDTTQIRVSAVELDGTF